jgi:prepilin-type N-terminal cleavage/methylation domain-containing protein
VIIQPSSHLGRQGFTLIELLLAITIFILVIGTIYVSLRAATQALVIGRETMEIYQTSRAGMNRMVVDLRRALAPAAFPFDERKKEDQMNDVDEYYLEEESDKFQITFRGDSQSVQFVVRQEMETEDGPYMDIREVRYKIGQEKNLVKEIYRSLLEARLAEMHARRMEQRMPQEERGRGRRIVPTTEGLLEKPVTQVLCENVEEVSFKYFDGKDWRETWDSEEVIINEFSRDIDLAELSDEDEEKIGLPRLVKIDLKITGEIHLNTCTDIPAADLNIVGARGSESDFGTAYRSSCDRLTRLRDRDRGQRPR